MNNVHNDNKNVNLRLMNWQLQTALAGAAGGATAGLVADSVLYAVDSAKVRAQSKVGGGSSDYRILFRGIVPSIALGSIPVFGTFFFLYAPVREYLHHSSSLEEYQLQFILPLTSMICAVPATIIGVPSDVIKKRLVLGIDKNFFPAINRGGLFAGWHVNLVRDLPFAGVKVGLYEMFVSYYKSWYGLSKRDPISPQAAALCGITSGITCAILTCPLDVINTKIKASETSSTSILDVGKLITKNDGVKGLFRGVAMRSIILGLGSSIFWPIQRSFSTYWQPIH